MWEVYGVCPCGYKSILPFGSLFHLHLEICPYCGKDKEEFSIRKMRYVCDAKLFNPLTWFDGHWEVKND